MPDGQNLVTELKYKESIKKLSSNEKLDYVIDQIYDINVKFNNTLTKNKKAGSKYGAITGGIAAAGICIIEYFTKRG